MVIVGATQHVYAQVVAGLFSDRTDDTGQWPDQWVWPIKGHNDPVQEIPAEITTPDVSQLMQEDGIDEPGGCCIRQRSRQNHRRVEPADDNGHRDLIRHQQLHRSSDSDL